MYKKTYIIFLSIFFIQSCKIKKAYEALHIYDYFKAKKKLSSIKKHKTTPVHYGLATIRIRQDNPFHNTYIAYSKIKELDSSYSISSIKQKEKWEKLGISKKSILNLKQQISSKLFKIALNKNKVHWYQNFIDSNLWSNHINKAIKLRDELEFELAKKNSSLKELYDFLTKYPNSHLYNQALKVYNKLHFEKSTQNKTISQYIQFIKNNPNSIYIKKAQNEIYKIETKENTITSFEKFILKYPQNININNAWKEIYRKYKLKHTEEGIKIFLTKYPNYPYKEKITNDLSIIKKDLFPVKIDGFWGFENSKKEIIIKPKYNYVGLFINGLAIVELNEKYGFINKKGEPVIPIKYEYVEAFSSGFSVVSINDYYGLINLAGEKILDFKYDDISKCQNNIVYANLNDKYNFYDSKGKKIYSENFEEIKSFDGKTAIVKQNKKYGVLKLNSKKTFIIEPNYQKINRYNKILFKCKSDSTWIIVNENEDTLTNNFYDEIMNFSNGLAYIQKNNKYGYIDTNFQETLPIKFNVFDNSNLLAQFNNGSARIVSKNKMGLIDKTGKKILPCIFKFCGYWNNLIPIQKKNYWGYCNKEISLSIKYKFQKAEQFIKNKAIVEFENNLGIINEKGDFMLPPNYSKIYWKKNHIIAKDSNAKFFIFDCNLNQINKIGAISILFINKNKCILEYEKNSKIITLKNTPITSE